MTDLVIQVVNLDYQPVTRAQVTVEREGRGVATGTTDDRGRLQLRLDAAGELRIRVEAPGFESEQRAIEDDAPRQVFMLGRPGMPFYYRGNVRVPFEPVEDAVGILLRGPDADAEDDVAARAERVTQETSAQVIRSGGNFARSRIAVVGAPGDSAQANPDALLDQLAGKDEVEQAGALVKLFDDNASFLTDTVIARFADGVGDDRVAAVTGHHGLTDAGRLDALGNVHRLRFDGPATYAVLEASNALAEEPEVVYAEPDLVR